MVHIELRGMKRVFRDGTRIGPVDLTVDDGELVTLLGPSGSGKTTTLRMIAGFIEPEAGALRFDGQDMVGVSPRERGIGMVFQSTSLFPNMNVFQNISFALDMAEWPRRDVIDRVEELAKLLDIERLLSRRIDEISGGEAQRVALARALAIRPRLLLLDEPLSALDAQLKERLQFEIRRIQRKLEITTIYVTHAQPEAFAVSDRIAVLNEGIIVQEGTPEELYDNPKTEFVARFVGGGNVFKGTVVNSGNGRVKVEVANEVFELQGDAPRGEEIIFTIKPEDIICDLSDRGVPVTVLSVIPQIGAYKVILQFNGMEVDSLTNDMDFLRGIRSSEDKTARMRIKSSEAVILRKNQE
ncbi:ABC transporter ATP-binding protein [Candidatus Thorarchaeota archaeon]|nr:MAG: ABC transporter ATP-binding protein [Candidatus Thorarchaeota archaeon]